MLEVTQRHHMIEEGVIQALTLIGVCVLYRPLSVSHARQHCVVPKRGVGGLAAIRPDVHTVSLWILTFCFHLDSCDIARLPRELAITQQSVKIRKGLARRI